MNNVTLVGYVGKDPEKRTTPSGQALASFRLAVRNPIGKTTNWFQIVVWGKLVDAVATYVRKGMLVAVSGSVEIRSYEAKDGSKRESVEINASRVDFLGGAGADREDGDAPPPPQKKPRSEDDWDPFEED